MVVLMEKCLIENTFYFRQHLHNNAKNCKPIRVIYYSGLSQWLLIKIVSSNGENLWTMMGMYCLWF
jgi:hypothetical protein